MAEFFEVDPLTGIKTETSYNDETGELTLIRTADDEDVLDFAQWARNEAGVNKEGIAEGWWLYAKLTPMTILKMRAKGINIFDKNCGKDMFREINEHYPKLKCTTGNEGKKAAPIYFMPSAIDG